MQCIRNANLRTNRAQKPRWFSMRTFSLKQMTSIRLLKTLMHIINLNFMYMNNRANLSYEDQERLKVVFSFLIINVESINSKFGLLKEFALANNLYGVTNGKLYGLAEMMDPPPRLYQMIDEILIPLGLEEKKDYVLTYERLLRGVDGHEDNCPSMIGEEIPECSDVTWLGSIITEKGQFVWYNEIIR